MAAEKRGEQAVINFSFLFAARVKVIITGIFYYVYNNLGQAGLG